MTRLTNPPADDPHARPWLESGLRVIVDWVPNHMRKRHPALTRGGYRPEEGAPDDVFAYRRTGPDGDVLIALNFAAQERQLPHTFRGVALLSSDPHGAEDAASSRLRFAPHEGLVLAAR
jgi:glycosidase